MDHPVDTGYHIIEFSTSLENKGRPLCSIAGPILLNHNTQSRMVGIVAFGGAMGLQAYKIKLVIFFGKG